jgi:hypothetical protein
MSARFADRLEPRTVCRQDSLESRVQARLNGRVRGLRIVIIRGRGIVLRGTANTYYAKQVAQHAIMSETDSHRGERNSGLVTDSNSPNSGS